MHMMKRSISILALFLLAGALSAGDQKIQWYKVNVDCRRQRRKSRQERELPNDRGKVTKNHEHIEITVEIETRLDFELKDLQFETRIIGERVAEDRDDRIPEVVAKTVKTIETVVPYKKLHFVAIKTMLTEMEEKLKFDNDKETRLSGHTYLGYIALLKDADGKLLMVKAENTKIKRLAEDLQIIPEDIELTRKGGVESR